MHVVQRKPTSLQQPIRRKDSLKGCRLQLKVKPNTRLKRGKTRVSANWLRGWLDGEAFQIFMPIRRNLRQQSVCQKIKLEGNQAAELLSYSPLF